MKLSIICLSLILLTGCDDFPAIKPQERCGVVLEEKVNDGQTDYYSGHCRCHLYAWTRDGIGRITESTNKPLNYCDKLIGYGPKATGDIYQWQESIRLWLIRHER